MSTKITYNGKTTDVPSGYIATIPCKDFKMATDVVVEAPEGAESGGSSINVQPLTVTENGTWDAPDGQAYDPVTVDVKPITEPITITENGVYPVPKGGTLEFGKEVKFKEVITEADFEAYAANATPVAEEDGNTTYLIDGDSWGISRMSFGDPSVTIWLLMNTGDNGAAYTINGSVFNPEIIDNCWMDGSTMTPIDTPTIIIPEGATMSADLATTAIFFDIETKSLDGWGDITVNVAPLPIEVSTEAEMTALLKSGEVGGVYKYTGTTGTYENGALYVLENDLITFTIDGTSYEAEDGMTWGQWVASEYNTDGYAAHPNLGTGTEDSKVPAKNQYCVTYNSSFVSFEDLIIANASYGLQYETGGGGAN